jgi:hypothetical protein
MRLVASPSRDSVLGRVRVENRVSFLFYFFSLFDFFSWGKERGGKWWGASVQLSKSGTSNAKV